MDDGKSRTIRQKLAQKPPGERLTLEEIRELKKIEAAEINRRIERGLRHEDHFQVWHEFFAEGRWRPTNRRLF